MRVFRFSELKVGDKFIHAQGETNSPDPRLFEKTALKRARIVLSGADVSQFRGDTPCIKIIA